jgi:5'-deoxynucleotidase YfbR-like HD superfamily hydrolase
MSEANKSVAGKGFESRLSTDEQYQQRDRELQDLFNKLSEINLTEAELLEIMDHAAECYLLLNPLSATDNETERQNVLRFRSWWGIDPEFKETNWQHTVKMVNAYCRLSASFPNVVKNFDSKLLIETILWHDTPEFLYGDMPLDQQNDQAKIIKSQREQQAAEIIRDNSRLGQEAYKILNSYEERQTKESKLVKIIDILAGVNSYYELLMRALPNNETAFSEGFQQKVHKFAEYINQHELVSLHSRSGGLIDSLGKDLGYDINDEHDRELDNFIYCLEANVNRYNNFPWDLQLDIGKPDFSASLKNSTSLSVSQERFDLFYEPPESGRNA